MTRWIITLLLVVLFSPTPKAKAYEILGAEVNRDRQAMALSIAYTGGLKEHTWNQVDAQSCSPVQGGGYGTYIRLLDSGWEDTGTDLITERLFVELKGLRCKMRPFEVTVFIGSKQITVLID